MGNDAEIIPITVDLRLMRAQKASQRFAERLQLRSVSREPWKEQDYRTILTLVLAFDDSHVASKLYGLLMLTVNSSGKLKTTFRALAKRIGVPPSTVSLSLTRLSTQGLIRYWPDFGGTVIELLPVPEPLVEKVIAVRGDK